MTLSRFERRAQIGPWFAEEVISQLESIDTANHAIASILPDSAELRYYQRGYEDALRAVAQTFGIAYYPEQQRPVVTIMAPEFARLTGGIA